MNDWIKDLPPAQDTVISTALKGSTMESTAITQEQKPEVYLAVDLESMSKGGYKKTIKCSVRVFNGDAGTLYRHLEEALGMGFTIANETIRQQEDAGDE